MKKYKGAVVMLMVSLAFITCLFWLLQTEEQQNQRADITISVVLYGENQSRWKAMDQGIQQACNDLNIEKPLLHITGNYDSATQKTVLERQLTSKMDGLLIAPCNSAELQEYLENLGQEIPIVAVENSVGSTIPYISADNSEMGRQLANSLQNSEKNIVLLDTGKGKENVNQRRAAFEKQMNENHTSYTVWQCDETPLGYIETVSKCLKEEKPDILVALDNESLESASAALPEGSNVKLYGIGCSEKVVYGLDNQSITEVCFQNEFSVGYLAMLELASKLGKYPKPAEIAVEYQMINYQNMYMPASERLLFPIIQ